MAVKLRRGARWGDQRRAEMSVYIAICFWARGCVL